MKSPIDNLINKKLFIQLRDTFPLQYKYSSLFYNSDTVKDMISSLSNFLTRICKKVLDDTNSNSSNTNEEDDSSNIVLSTINDQYRSMYKAIDDSFKNIDNNTLDNIITHISDIDNSTLTIRMIVKGLILLQIAYNTRDIVFNTIENNYKFDYISEHNLSYLEYIQEHMYENQFNNIDVNNSFGNDSSNYDDNSIDDDIDTFTEEINKRINDKLLLLESEDDEIEFTEADLFEDDYGYNQSDDNEVSYSTDNIDEYIRKLYYKIMFLFKESIDKIIDVDYKLLPNLDIIVCYIISILMLYIQKF